MSRTEKSLETKLVKACLKKGITALKGFTRTNAGFVDRIIFNPLLQHIHYIEIKNENYYQRTELQIMWAKRIEQSGGTYFFINGDEEMTKYIKEYINGE